MLVTRRSSNSAHNNIISTNQQATIKRKDTQKEEGKEGAILPLLDNHVVSVSSSSPVLSVGGITLRRACFRSHVRGHGRLEDDAEATDMASCEVIAKPRAHWPNIRNQGHIVDKL